MNKGAFFRDTKKIVFSLVSLFSIIGYGVFVFAAPPGVGGYNPGEILDPECAPGDVDCVVKLQISGGGSPAGSDAQIQYNNAGAFGADALFTRDATTKQTTIGADFTTLSGGFSNATGKFEIGLLGGGLIGGGIGSILTDPVDTDLFVFSNIIVGSDGKPDGGYNIAVNNNGASLAGLSYRLHDGTDNDAYFNLTAQGDGTFRHTIEARKNLFRLRASGAEFTLQQSDSSLGLRLQTSSGATDYWRLPVTAGTAGYVLTSNGDGAMATWQPVSGGGGITGIGTIDSITRSANGAGISGSNLILQTGNKVLPGLLIGETNSNGVTLGVGAGVGADTTNGVFIGTSAGYDAFALTGANFIGYYAGYDAGSAIDSTFIGRFAGAYAQQADHSSFIGAHAGNAATSANYSVFIGEDAGRNATNASNSIFLGYQTGRGATDANNSVFIGDFAGYGAVTAKNSIFIGTQAGYNDTVNNSNSESILIGNGTSTGGHGNSIAIGTDATNTASNQLMIGSATRPINDLTIVGTGFASCTIDISGGGGIGTGISCSSDERLKTNIENLESTTLDTLLNVKTVRYNWNANPTGNKSIGFLAQDLQQYFPELVKTGHDGYLQVNYAGITPILVEAIREMNLHVTELSNMERPNTWRDSLIAWFGNVENGITELFVGRAHMRELCIGEQNNETCLTKDQIDQLLQILPTEQYETKNPIIENTPPVGESVNETEIIDTEGELTEENVPESTNPVIETKPEPETEPQVMSENNSADTSEQ